MLRVRRCGASSRAAVGKLSALVWRFAFVPVDISRPGSVMTDGRPGTHVGAASG